jgi:hypothetical protein
MSVHDRYAGMTKTGFSGSQEISREFLMAVRCSKVDLRLPENQQCVTKMVNVLNSININMVSQLFESECTPTDVNSLFNILEKLMPSDIFLILKNIILVIRGGPLLDRDFLRSIKRPNSSEFDARRNNVYPRMQKILNDMGILYISQVAHQSNMCNALLFEQICTAMRNESKTTLILFFEKMVDTAKQFQ